MKDLIAAFFLVSCAVCSLCNVTITQLDSNNGTVSFICTVCASTSFDNHILFLLRDTDTNLGAILFSSKIGTIMEDGTGCGDCQTIMLSQNLTDGGLCVAVLLIGQCYCRQNFTLECRGPQNESDQFNVIGNVSLQLLTSDTGASIQYLNRNRAVCENGQEYDVILARFPRSRHGVPLRPISIEGQELNTSDHLNIPTSTNGLHQNFARIFLIETGGREYLLILVLHGKNFSLTGGSSLFNFLSSEQPTGVTHIQSTSQNETKSSSNTTGTPADI